MIGWERRVLLRHYVEQGMTKTQLAERFGISRQAIHRWIREGELDRDLAADMVRYGPRSPVPTRGSVQGHHREPAGRVPEAHGGTALRRDQESGLPGRLHAGEGVREGDPPTTRGAGCAVRDGAGSPGPGRFRRFPAALVQALWAARRSGLFPSCGCSYRSQDDDAERVRRTRARVRTSWACLVLRVRGDREELPEDHRPAPFAAPGSKATRSKGRRTA